MPIQSKGKSKSFVRQNEVQKNNRGHLASVEPEDQVDGNAHHFPILARACPIEPAQYPLSSIAGDNIFGELPHSLPHRN